MQRLKRDKQWREKRYLREWDVVTVEVEDEEHEFEERRTRTRRSEQWGNQERGGERDDVSPGRE